MCLVCDGHPLRCVCLCLCLVSVGGAACFVHALWDWSVFALCLLMVSGFQFRMHTKTHFSSSNFKHIDPHSQRRLSLLTPPFQLLYSHPSALPSTVFLVGALRAGRQSRSLIIVSLNCEDE